MLFDTFAPAGQPAMIKSPYTPYPPTDKTVLNFITICGRKGYGDCCE